MQTVLSLIAIAAGGYGPIYLVMYLLFRWKYKKKLRWLDIFVTALLSYVTGVVILMTIPSNVMGAGYQSAISILVFVLTTSGFISWFMDKGGIKTNEGDLNG